MTASPSTPRSPGEPVAEALPPDLRLAAAARLVGGVGRARATAARNLITAAPMHGIDLDLFFACRLGETIGPVCLAVPGAGRTAVLFLSAPDTDPESERTAAQRTAAVRAALDHLAGRRPDLRMAQALPGPDEAWAARALAEGGLRHIATLQYLKRPLAPRDADLAHDTWPEGITLETITHPDDPRTHHDLIAALDRSYVDTRDCPELCGLRDTADVLASHRAAGAFDPKLWRLVRLHNEPVGCCLLNRNPDLASVELVYLGLAPEVRGRGLGANLMRDALALAARTIPEREITCAVDARNDAAVRLYRNLGFTPFATKLAYVRGLPHQPV